MKKRVSECRNIDNGMEPAISSLKSYSFFFLPSPSFFYSDHVIFSSWCALNDIGSPVVFHARRRRRQQSTQTHTNLAVVVVVVMMETHLNESGVQSSGRVKLL